MSEKSTLIKDIDSDFIEGLSNDVILKGKQALNNAILNLMSVNSQNGMSTGNRPYEPTYGLNIEQFLFDPLDEITAQNIKDEIYNKITTFMPELYVVRNSILIRPNYENDCYDVIIGYIYQGNPNDISFVIKRKSI